MFSQRAKSPTARSFFKPASSPVSPKDTSRSFREGSSRAKTGAELLVDIERVKENINKELAKVARIYGGSRILRELSQPRGYILVRMNLQFLGNNDPLFVFPNSDLASRFANDPRVIQCVGPSGNVSIETPGPIVDVLLSVGRVFVGIKEKLGSGWTK